MTEEDSRAYCENVFALELEGAKRVTNKSLWRRFPVISNKRWTVGNRVLVGDALRTAHFSIGSGTHLALEDVQAQAHALADHPRNVREALALIEAQRRPIVDKLAGAATCSATWHDNFGEHLKCLPGSSP